MISFDTNILVYVTASLPDAKARPARDLIARARSPVRNGYVLAFDNLSACPPVMGKTGCGTQKIRGSPLLGEILTGASFRSEDQGPARIRARYR